MKKNIEDLVADKIYGLINYVLSKLVKPDIKVDKVTQLDEEKIAMIKKQYGIEGIILDVDDTLRKDMQQIPKCNEEWLNNLKNQLKIIIISNGSDKDMNKFFKNKGIEYIEFAHKPLKKSFITACKKMNLEPEKILVIGDSVIDDIYGGKRNKMKTLMVKKVDGEER